MKKEYQIKTLSELPLIADKLLSDFGKNKLFAFYGDLGAGKTTLIKEICKQLNVVDNVTSPTFAILNEYYTEKDELICHFDFYRIEKESEILRIGFYEYLDNADMIFIEWPEKAELLLPENRVNVKITTDEAGTRLIKVARKGKA